MGILKINPVHFPDFVTLRTASFQHLILSLFFLHLKVVHKPEIHCFHYNYLYICTLIHNNEVMWITTQFCGNLFLINSYPL